MDEKIRVRSEEEIFANNGENKNKNKNENENENESENIYLSQQSQHFRNQFRLPKNETLQSGNFHIHIQLFSLVNVVFSLDCFVNNENITFRKRV
jgi:hypothetical protein